MNDKAKAPEAPNSFTVRGRLPSLNDYINACRSHWSKGAKLKTETEELIFWSIKAAWAAGLCRPVKGPCWIEFVWCEYGARRDLDNIYSAKKYILDAMQSAGIIENDDRKHVVGLVDGIRQADKDCDCVHVIIREVKA